MLKVTHYKPTNDPRSNVVAMVNFYVEEWDLHLNGCRYIRKRNGGFFVSYPSKKVEKENEEPSYFPYYCFGKEKNSRFQSGAQRAISDYINKNQAINTDE